MSTSNGDSKEAIATTKIDIGKIIDTIHLIFPTPLYTILQQQDQAKR